MLRLQESLEEALSKEQSLALLMLARDARAELVGISTVFGNASVDTTTANALARLETELPASDELAQLLAFARASQRGLAK